MSAQAGIGESSNYPARFFALALTSFAQLVRPPSHTRRAEAARRLAGHALLITAVVGVLVVAFLLALALLASSIPVALPAMFTITMETGQDNRQII